MPGTTPLDPHVGPDPVLQLREVGKKYGSLAVLKGIDLDVRRGEFVAVVGPSGSGKSTLLSILGCLDRPSSGSYRIEGEDVAFLDDLHLSRVRNFRIGFVFQSFNLIPHLTVLENVELPLFYARVPPQRRRTICEEIVGRVGLGPRRSHFPTELSGGECQRAAVARALVNDPSVLLADEPTGNLDSANSAEILRLFEELHASGRTVVIVTHERDIARRALRCVSIRDGLIESDHRRTAEAAS